MPHLISVDLRAISDPGNKWATVYQTVLSSFASPLYFIFPFLDRLVHRFPFLFPERAAAFKAVDEFNGLIFRMIDDRAKEIESGAVDREDLLTSMVMATRGLISDSEQPYSDSEDLASLSNEELRSNIFIFFVGGHDPTGHALTAAMYFLAKNPVRVALTGQRMMTDQL